MYIQNCVVLSKGLSLSQDPMQGPPQYLVDLPDSPCFHDLGRLGRTGWVFRSRPSPGISLVFLLALLLFWRERMATAHDWSMRP